MSAPEPPPGEYVSIAANERAKHEDRAVRISMVIVLRGLHDLRDAGLPPQTARQIAAYLDSDANDVLHLLVEMKARKIVSDHKHGADRVWQRWGK